MNKEEVKAKFINLVDIAIYKSNNYYEEDNNDLNDIISYFQDSKSILDDIKGILGIRNNENYIYFNKLLIEVLISLPKEKKMNILYNSDIYIELFKEKVILLRIWQTLTKKDKLKFINDKNKCNDIDFYLINETIKDKSNFKENYILKEIINNEIVRNKIPDLTIDVPYSPSVLNNLDLSNYELCSKLSKKSYTNLLIKSCSILGDFIDLYNSNNKIINLVERNSIIFKNTENKEVAQYLKNNVNMIGKFNNKYLSFFDEKEIEDIFKKKDLSNETFSSILEKMYKLFPDRAEELITENNLSKCVKHSLDIYPFEKISEKNRNNIFNNYHLFNRFIDTIMVEAIINNYEEEEILNFLRNPVFIKDQSSYAIELLLNKLSFKSTFNMLQSKTILDSVSNLNVGMNSNDTIFIKGFLDSPSLIDKTDHNMLFEMLTYLDTKDVIYYIITPYIANHLTSSEIIELSILKGITIDNILSSNVLKDKMKKDDYITYIDRLWLKNVDLNIFKNKELVNILFNLSYDDIDNIDFDEVNYLFETIKMKSLLSKQNSKCTVITYKSVLASYLTFGLDKTIEMVSNGNKCVNLNEVIGIKKEVINERLLLFKEENSTIIQNLHFKIDANLKKITECEDINCFAKAVKKNTYLDNIIYLMLENNYASYNMIIEKFYDYVKYYKIDPYSAKKDLYYFCKSFIEKFINNKGEEYNNEFYAKMFKNFKLKENIIYSKRKQIARDFIERQKNKVFVRALTDANPEDYLYAFVDGFPINDLKHKFIEHLSVEAVDAERIIKDILIPWVEGRFEKDECLNKMGITKPKDYDLYYNYMNNIEHITSINKELLKIKDSHDKKDVIDIMECICYNKPITIKVSAREKKTIKKISTKINSIDGEIYIDKKDVKFTYGNRVDIYNIDDIVEYNKYINIITEILSKTKSFIRKYINTQRVENYYREDYLRKVASEKLFYPLTTKYYELRNRVFSLKDMEKVFNGYKLDKHVKSTPELEDFLFNKHNLIMVAEGYYDGVVDNLGLIICSFKEICEEYKSLYPEQDINLANAEKVVKVINYQLNPISKSIDPDIINSIFDDDYYVDSDVNTRLSNLEYVFKEGFKKISSTIPFISVKENNYEAIIVDNYNQEMFRSQINTNYRIGARGNDFLHYAILNKNGVKVIIKKDEEVIARLLGLRHGNTVFFNKVEGQYDDIYESILHKLASELIMVTKDTNEPIEFVTILINKLLKRSYGIRIDSTICPIIDNPISKEYIDYLEFKKTKYLNTINEDGFYNNYKEKISTILASSAVVDKNNFKYYDAEAKYLRNRNNVLKLSNNLEDYYINKINTIITLCNLEGTSDFVGDIKLSTVDTMYLGDDFVIFLTNNKQLIKYVLPYDKRANNEVDLIIESLKNKL